MNKVRFLEKRTTPLISSKICVKVSARNFAIKVRRNNNSDFLEEFLGFSLGMRNYYMTLHNMDSRFA